MADVVANAGAKWLSCLIQLWLVLSILARSSSLVLALVRLYRGRVSWLWKNANRRVDGGFFERALARAEEVG